MDYHDMDRPAKRRRLTTALVSSYEYEEDDGADLERDRYANDMRLKGQFEDIFAKYSRDFSGIGDEVDLETGKIVVNNGHLTSMRHERDVGSRQAQQFLRSFADELVGGTVSAAGVDDQEPDFRCNGHGHIESTEQEDDDVECLTEPDEGPEDDTAEEQTESGRRLQLAQQEVPAQQPQPPDISLLPANHPTLQALSQSIAAQIAQFLGQWQQPQAPAIDPLWAAPPLPLQPRAPAYSSTAAGNLSRPSLTSTPISDAAQRPFRGDTRATSSWRHQQQSVWAPIEPRRKPHLADGRVRSAAREGVKPAYLEEAPNPEPATPDSPNDTPPRDSHSDSGNVRRREPLPPFTSQEMALLYKLRTIENRRWKDIAKYFPSRKTFHLVSNYHRWIKFLELEDTLDNARPAQHALGSRNRRSSSHEGTVSRSSKPSAFQGSLMRDSSISCDETSEDRYGTVHGAKLPEAPSNHLSEQTYAYANDSGRNELRNMHASADDTEPQTVPEIPDSLDSVDQYTSTASSQPHEANPPPTNTEDGPSISISPAVVIVQIPHRREQQFSGATQRPVPRGVGSEIVTQSTALQSIPDDPSESAPARLERQFEDEQSVQRAGADVSPAAPFPNSTGAGLNNASTPAAKPSAQLSEPHQRVRVCRVPGQSDTPQQSQDPEVVGPPEVSQFLPSAPLAREPILSPKALASNHNPKDPASVRAGQPSSSPVPASVSSLPPGKGQALSREKPYKCAQCGRQYASLSRLNHHRPCCGLKPDAADLRLVLKGTSLPLAVGENSIHQPVHTAKGSSPLAAKTKTRPLGRTVLPQTLVTSKSSAQGRERLSTTVNSEPAVSPPRPPVTPKPAARTTHLRNFVPKGTPIQPNSTANFSSKPLDELSSTATAQPASTPRRRYGQPSHLSTPKTAPSRKPLPATPVAKGMSRKRRSQEMDNLEDLPPSAKKVRTVKLRKTPRQLVDLIAGAESEDELGL